PLLRHTGGKVAEPDYTSAARKEMDAQSGQGMPTASERVRRSHEIARVQAAEKRREGEQERRATNLEADRVAEQLLGPVVPGSDNEPPPVGLPPRVSVVPLGGGEQCIINGPL